ncbi:MAG: type IV secretion system DNA-binding domain-containing protein [Cyanobacteria bacterium P01_F01_bin.150]
MTIGDLLIVLGLFLALVMFLGSVMKLTPSELARVPVRDFKAEEERKRVRSRRRRRRRGPPISLAGHCVGLDEMDHTIALAQSGAGKNLIMGPTFRSLVKAVTRDPSRRLLVIETKGSLVQWLEGMNVPYHLITFSYRQGHSWDLAQDFSSYSLIVQLCYTLLPPLEGNNAFFRNGARAIFIATLFSIHVITRSQWGFDDLVYAGLSSLETLKTILKQTPLGNLVINTLVDVGDDSNDSDEAFYKVRSELASQLFPFMTAAAKYQYSEALSVVDFWEGKTSAPILVVKLCPERLDSEYPSASALIQRSLEFIMGLTPKHPKKVRKDKIIFIDDLNFYRKIPKFLEATELIRGCGGLLFALGQSVESLRSRSSYGDEADGFLSNFANVIMLRSMSPTTAKYFASLFGQHMATRESEARSYGKEGIQFRFDERKSLEPVVLDRAFLSMPPPSPENGITVYLKTQFFGEELEKVIPWKQVLERHPPVGHVAFTSLPADFEFPAPWTQARRDFLCGVEAEELSSIVETQGNMQENPLAEFEEEIRRIVYDIGWDAIEQIARDS